MAASVIVPAPHQLTAAEYRAEHRDLHFDAHQFDRPKISQLVMKANLDYLPDAGMRIVGRKQYRPSRWIPEWAHNESKFREVILKRAWHWCRSGRPFPTTVKFDEVFAACNRKLELLKKSRFNSEYASRHETLSKHIAAIERAGGYLQMITSLAYLSFRAGLEAPDIAAQMDLSKACVRTHILRLNQAAERLGYQQHVRHHTKGIVRAPEQLEKKRRTMGYEVKIKCLHYSAEVHDQVTKFRSMGWTWRRVAKKLNCSMLGLITSHRNWKLKPASQRQRLSRQKKRWYTEIEREQIMAYRASGIPWKEISATLHRSTASMQWAFCNWKKHAR